MDCRDGCRCWIGAFGKRWRVRSEAGVGPACSRRRTSAADDRNGRRVRSVRRHRGALAKVYQTKLGYHTAVRSSDGSVENVRLLESGKADLAFAMSDVASFALGGLESFQSSGPVARMKSVAGLYLNYVQIVTKKTGTFIPCTI